MRSALTALLQASLHTAPNPAKLGLVLSRFAFNELPDQNYQAGEYELQALVLESVVAKPACT